MDRITQTHPHAPRTPRPTRNQRSTGFTLIELLVVISIIALLVGILLPALGAARRTAQNSQCLSNIRQMNTAAMSFAADHQFHVQISSTDTIWQSAGAIPSELRGKVAQFAGQSRRIKDWASAIVPYMGGDPDDDFESTDTKVSKAFIDPSDPNQDDQQPGYQIFNNITGGVGKERKPISYGVNADATTYNNNGSAPGGLWANGPGVSEIRPYKGDVTNGSLDAIRSTSNTMIFADCGTRAGIGAGIVTSGDQLFYTANTQLPLNTDEDKIGTLAAVHDATNPAFRFRMPLKVNDTAGNATGGADRHGDKINVAFADGHAASFDPASFSDVYLSPHK